MKTYFFLGLILVVFAHWATADNITSVEMVSSDDHRIKLINVAARNIKHLVEKYWNQNDNSDSFVGRCFGIAKKIRAILPIAIFMMGVIMTLLTFLTIFSLKSLGMLGLLLLINTSGAVAKVAAAFAHKHESKAAQDVHFHIHQNKDGDYHLGHSGYGWADDRVESDYLNKIESYNLYNKLASKPNFRSNNR